MHPADGRRWCHIASSSTAASSSSSRQPPPARQAPVRCRARGSRVARTAGRKGLRCGSHDIQARLPLAGGREQLRRLGACSRRAAHRRADPSGQDRRRSRARRAHLQRCALWCRYRRAKIPPARGACWMAAGSRCTPVRARMSAARRKEPVSEDCLCLNVWTPALRDGGKRPVMVYIHGGEYSSGSGSSPLYDGTRLCLRGDVVVVTVNHRLNMFGHLYLARLARSRSTRRRATSGMLDLVLALQVGARSRGGIRRRSAARDGVRPVGRRREDRDAAWRCRRRADCFIAPRR